MVEYKGLQRKCGFRGFMVKYGLKCLGLGFGTRVPVDLWDRGVPSRISIDSDSEILHG